MNIVTPLPPNLMTKNVDEFVIYPYVKFDFSKLPRDWITYPTWKLNNEIEILCIAEIDVVMIHPDDIYNPTLVSSFGEIITPFIDLRDWKIKRKSGDMITYLNTKLVHPYAITVQIDGAFNYLEDEEEELIWKKFREISNENYFPGTYEILYKDQSLKEFDLDILLNWSVKIIAGFEELKDVKAKAENLLPYTLLIKGLVNDLIKPKVEESLNVAYKEIGKKFKRS